MEMYMAQARRLTNLLALDASQDYVGTNRPNPSTEKQPSAAAAQQRVFTCTIPKSLADCWLRANGSRLAAGMLPLLPLTAGLAAPTDLSDWQCTTVYN